MGEAKRRKDPWKDPKRPCVYCGEAAGDSKDHVPPKSVLPSIAKQQLITVPACKACNGGFSASDEEFRVFLGIKAGNRTDMTKSFWKGKALPTLNHNRRLKSEVIAQTRVADVRLPSGLVLPNQRVIRWDAEKHNPFIERMTRALFFHVYGEILPKECGVQVTIQQTVSQFLEPVYQHFKFFDVGDGQFKFACTRLEAFPTASMWFFSFLGSAHMVSACTDPDNSMWTNPPP